ncbi:MAG: Cro/CI family transcriptional regulator [Alphaproteobacteria bacterium]
MRDRGLEEAIKAAGGVSALARELGIAQPSVSNWDRIPPERVLTVESLTGVPRHVLRPDLYPSSPTLAPENDGVDEIDQLRASEYGLLALLLFKAPTAAVLKRVSTIKGDATPLGMAHLRLAQAASATTVEQAGREYFDLFLGVGRSELLPYASYYLTGFLHERPLAAIRGDYVKLGVERTDDQKVPEDHLGLLCDVMAGLAMRKFGDGYATEKAFFETHVEPFAARFFADLEMTEGKPFYRAVGEVGRLFMEIESEAFDFAA